MFRYIYTLKKQASVKFAFIYGQLDLMFMHGIKLILIIIYAFRLVIIIKISIKFSKSSSFFNYFHIYDTNLFVKKNKSEFYQGNFELYTSGDYSFDLLVKYSLYMLMPLKRYFNQMADCEFLIFLLGLYQEYL